MITSESIQKKEFTRGVRGYKEEEVDQFLDLVALDVDALIVENAKQKKKIGELERELERQHGSESAVMGTLEAAKALMEEIGVSAEKRAEIVLKTAELDAERIKREALEAVEQMTQDAIALSRRWELFSARFRNLLETELERFDSFETNKLMNEMPETPYVNRSVQTNNLEDTILRSRKL